MKHTPGPWFYDETSGHEIRNRDIFVAMALDDCPELPYEKAKANALLIAAAPDLLEALRKIANISRYPISDPENIAFALTAAREIARVAMAKIEGKPD